MNDLTLIIYTDWMKLNLNSKFWPNQSLQTITLSNFHRLNGIPIVKFTDPFHFPYHANSNPALE